VEQITNTSSSTLRDGSTLYYSLLFLETAQRDRVARTLALIKVISTTLYDVSEPQVAEKKIHWWHEELARLSKQSARHPACVDVQEYLNHVTAVNALLRLLSTAANERYSPITSESDWQEMLVADYGARIALIDHALGNKESVKQHDSVPLGLGQMHRLSSLAERLHNGYSVFSDERYAQYELTPAQLLSDHAKGDALIQSELTQTRTTLTQALQEQRNSENRLNGSLLIQIMTELRLSQVNVWIRRKPDLLRESITLTPLRKFFITYRTKRRFTKSSNAAIPS